MSAVVAELVPRRRTVDDLLADARSGLDRLTPSRPPRRSATGRCSSTSGRTRSGSSRARSRARWWSSATSSSGGSTRPATRGCPRRRTTCSLVVLCSEGYTSSLAAAALQELGVHGATDLAGGFVAWQRAGLPVAAGGTPAGSRSGSRPVRLAVDAARAEVRVHGRPVPLSAHQLRLLVALQRAAGAVVPRAVAAAEAGLDPASPRAVDVLVCRLRRRLGPEAGRLVTVRGLGFRLLAG